MRLGMHWMIPVRVSNCHWEALVSCGGSCGCLCSRLELCGIIVGAGCALCQFAHDNHQNNVSFATCRALGAMTVWQLPLHHIERFLSRHGEVKEIVLPALMARHRQPGTDSDGWVSHFWELNNACWLAFAASIIQSLDSGIVLRCHACHKAPLTACFVRCWESSDLQLTHAPVQGLCGR